MRAASTFVAMPPLPTPAAPVPPSRTCARSASLRTSATQLRAALARVVVVDAVDVGQQHQHVGAHQMRDERGEPVVVAEADLVGGDRVVLVDDRDDAERQQPVERALRVAVVRAAYDVVGGQQHLPDGAAVAGRTTRCSARRSSP